MKDEAAAAKKCICGRECVKEFELAFGAKLDLCPLCSYLITKQTINGWGDEIINKWFKNKGWVK